MYILLNLFLGVESLMDSNDDDSETEDNCIDNASEVTSTNYQK